MLEMRAISKTFGDTMVLDDIHLTIQPGEFFSLLGPSGCGKTTLLRILGGFDTPTRGEVRLDGAIIDHGALSPVERPFNMVFQNYALFPHLSVWENVAFGLKVKKIPSATLRQRVDEALQLVKMAGLADRGIHTLSGGQKQRIALARAVVNQPKVLLLDEPLSALDHKLRQQMQIELCALQRRLNIAFIFVTHDQEEALRMSDRIAVINQGRIEQVGTPSDIYDRPGTPFVADFIGTINTLVGTVVHADTSQVCLRHVAGLELRAQPSKDGRRQLPEVAAGERAVLMVRPENMLIAPQPFAGPCVTIPGVIREILFKGQVTEILLEADIQGVPPLLISEPNGSAVLEQNRFEVGARVYASWEADDALVMRQSPS